MADNSIDNASLGKSLILDAVNMDEALAELLKVEVKRLKKLVKEDAFFEEAQKTHTLLRYIIMALTLTDEKINVGINLCKNKEPH
ncbi:MAG TPA: hypothetical protein VN608_08580 [Clostridia bacterium]|nr:hypothetical protein [Clostridia bacterium]